MSSAYGKNSKSIRKKDLQESKTQPLAINRIKFWDEADQGATGIDLGSLTIPASVAANGNTNPTASSLLAQNLFRYQNSLKIVSSISGELIRSSFKVVGNSRISFVGFTARDKEIFECTIDPAPQTGLQAVDARIQTARANLAIGVTDFPMGFDTTTLTEEIIVVRNGIVVRRNTNNSATTQDGAYYVVDSGSGFGSVIRFNTPPSGLEDDIFVTAVGNIIDSPSDSTFAMIEALAGQVDSIIPTLAALAGVPETDFQANPTSQDLKQFGERVIALEKGNTLTRGLASRSTSYNNIPAVNTWQLPDAGFSVNIPEDGYYELKVIGEMVSNSAAAWNGAINFGLGTSTTPGTNLVTGEVSGLPVVNSDTRGGVHYTSQAIFLTQGTTLYLSYIARNSIGVPTFQSNGIGFLASGVKPIVIEARKVADA